MQNQHRYVVRPKIFVEAFLSGLGFASPAPEHHAWAAAQYARVVDLMMQPRGERIYATHGYIAHC